MMGALGCIYPAHCLQLTANQDLIPDAQACKRL